MVICKSLFSSMVSLLRFLCSLLFRLLLFLFSFSVPGAESQPRKCFSISPCALCLRFFFSFVSSDQACFCYIHRPSSTYMYSLCSLLCLFSASLSLSGADLDRLGESAQKVPPHITVCSVLRFSLLQSLLIKLDLLHP